MKIGILGAGRWGVALGVHLSRKNYEITLYDINKEVIDKINFGIHPYIEGINISENVKATDNLEKLKDSELIVCALPSHVVREVFSKVRFEGKIIVSATKGMEIESLKRISEVIKELQRNVKVFVLSGPSFAEEVSKGLPTAVVLGYEEKYSKEALDVQKIFNSEFFRVYLNGDIIGVELGGTLKNVIAIACGISDGLGFGYNARAALITRGLVEMTRIGVFLGAKRETFFGLSGVGDLILTATSDLSRNRTFGVLIGKGVPVEEALKRIGQVVEGYKTVQALKKLIDKEGIYAPITDAVYRIVIEKENIQEVVNDLLLRIPRYEFD